MKINKKVLKLITLVVGLLVLVTLFLPLALLDKDGKSTLTGLDLLFGTKEKILLIEYGIKANLFVIIGYVAVLATIVLTLLSDKYTLITAVLFVVTAVTFIVGPATIKVFIGDSASDVETKLGVFAYVAMALSIVGAGTSALTFLTPAKKGKKRK